MNPTLVLSGYDLSDEGPGRTVNEDATLVREDLGLFAVADGAGGRGKGDVAATLALRSIENYVGSTVRRSHDRPDYDALGIAEQAKRLSAAIHQGHQNILEVISEDPKRKGMATTVVAGLFSARTNQLHIAHVGDSRCYRMRNGFLEQLTQDDTIGVEILQNRPETPPDLLEQLPRNSVIRALGMDEGFRVAVSSHDLIAGDMFLLCSDGLSAYVNNAAIWETLRAADPPSVLASELLSLALAARSQDNVSVLVLDCQEAQVDQAVDTRRYNELGGAPPSAPWTEIADAPNSADFQGPEIVSGGLDHVVDQFGSDSEFPTRTLPIKDDASAVFDTSLRALSPGSPEIDMNDGSAINGPWKTVEELEPAPETQSSWNPVADPTSPELDTASEEEEPYPLSDEDIEFEGDEDIDLDRISSTTPSKEPTTSSEEPTTSSEEPSDDSSTKEPHSETELYSKTEPHSKTEK
jgi:protein phosphatase